MPWYLIDNNQRVRTTSPSSSRQGPERAINMLPDGSMLNGIGFHRAVWTATRDNGRLTHG